MASRLTGTTTLTWSLAGTFFQQCSVSLTPDSSGVSVHVDTINTGPRPRGCVMEVMVDQETAVALVERYVDQPRDPRVPYSPWSVSGVGELDGERFEFSVQSPDECATLSEPLSSFVDMLAQLEGVRIEEKPESGSDVPWWVPALVVTAIVAFFAVPILWAWLTGE